MQILLWVLSPSLLTIRYSLYHGYELCFERTFFGPLQVVSPSIVFQFGGPLAVSVFLVVLSAVGEEHLQTIWRVCFGIGMLLPMTVFYLRIRMLSTRLFRNGAIKRK